jgi:hypothetical protein
MGHPQVTSSNPAVQIVRRALTDELHVLALLTAASARMKFVDAHHFAREDVPEQLANATSRLLREYLASAKPITHELVQSIFYLWASESYRRHWDAVRTHRQMIVYLANSHLGGFQRLDPYFKRMFWLGDRFQAAATQTPPLIQERWGEIELTVRQRTCALMALDSHGKRRMGYGFVRASTMFSDGFQRLLTSVLNLSSVLQCHWLKIKDPQQEVPDSQWAIARAFFIGDELVNFKEDRMIDEDAVEEDSVQDCVRLALIIYFAFVPAATPYVTDTNLPTLRAAVDTKALRNKLGRVLRDRAMSENMEERTLLFWIAALGAVASELVTNQEWFSVEAQKLAKKLTYFTWEAFAPVQEKFLMLDPLRIANKTKLTWILQRAVHADNGG